MKQETVRYWRRILVGNLIASAVVLFAFSGVTFRTPARSVVQAFLIAMLFSMCIGPLVGTVMPRIAPWIWRRIKFPFNWIAVAAAMVAMAVVGSVMAIAALVALRQVPAHQFGNWLEGSVRVAIVITLTVGLLITANETRRAREAQAVTEARLASLESRVQPHFLFNTLNSIAALIHDDPKGAERMTGQLAALMRSSLDQQATPLVSLEDELTTVHDYLAIEQVRFGDRLRYTVHVDDAARRARVPRMSIQTLVENSVKYAVSARQAGATIAITAKTGTDGRRTTFTVAVSDDGPGFDAAALPAGHGLALLRDRTALLFNQVATMTVESAPGTTTVTLRVPDTRDVPARLATDCT